MQKDEVEFAREETEQKNEKQDHKKGLWARAGDWLRARDEWEVRKRLTRVITFLLTASAAYLLGGLEAFFGTFPVAMALFCADREYLLAILAGTAAATLTGDLPLLYALCCLVILLLRVLAAVVPQLFQRPAREESEVSLIPYNPYGVEVSDGETAEDSCEKASASSDCLSPIFKESRITKLLCAAVGGFLCGLCLLIGGSFSFYSLYAALLLTVGVPAAALLVGGFSEGSKPFSRFLSVASVMGLCVLSAADRTVLGMPMAPFLAMLLTLSVTADKGFWTGALIGLLCGAAFDWIYIPLLILSAILLCLISPLKKNAGVAAVCGLIVVWCYYIGGENGLLKVLPPMLLSLPVYMLVEKYREMMRAPYGRAGLSDGLYFAEAVTEKSKNALAKERLAALSETFDSLSESFFKLSDRFRRSDALDLKQITDDAFEITCRDCKNREVCYGAAYGETLDAVKRVTAALHGKGVCSAEDLSAEFVYRCVRTDKLISELNRRISESTARIIKGGKNSFFAANCDDITALLEDALDNSSEEYECDIQLGERIFDYLCSAEMRVGGVVLYGNRCRRLVAKGVSLADGLKGERIEEIRRRISAIVGVEMTEPCFEVGRDGTVMRMRSCPQIRVSCACGRVSRSGLEDGSCVIDGERREEPLADLAADAADACGDMTGAFITDNSYFYSLISDGMGSGEEAAYTSSVCALFIEKMLSAGNRADITLRMLNNVIRSENMGCGSECSATVDLMELDLMSGVASFIKSGAAPTYIARQGTVYKVSARTMPVGIIKDADARITRFDTQKGDVIVMMSDGCCHDSEDCPWLVEYLCSYTSRGKETATVGESLCERLRDEIIREALKNVSEGEERDDISVSVTVVG